MGNFYSLCLLHVPCTSVQKEIIIKAVKEKLLGFFLVYKLACTELHGSDSFVYPVFVSKFYFDCESNIR